MVGFPVRGLPRRQGVQWGDMCVPGGHTMSELQDRKFGTLFVPLLKIDPFWDPLRGDPRFRKLLLEYAHPDSAPADAGSD